MKYLGEIIDHIVPNKAIFSPVDERSLLIGYITYINKKSHPETAFQSLSTRLFFN